MKGSINRYDGLEYEQNIIRKTIKEDINHKSIPLLDREDIEQELMLHLLKAKQQYDEIKYLKSAKSIVQNKLKDLIRFYKAGLRHTEAETISTSSTDHPEINALKDGAELTPDESNPRNISDEIWKMVKDKPSIYSDMIGIMLNTGNTKRAFIARELNIPRTTLDYHWNQLKKWVQKDGQIK